MSFNNHMHSQYYRNPIHLNHTAFKWDGGQSLPFNIWGNYLPKCSALLWQSKIKSPLVQNHPVSLVKVPLNMTHLQLSTFLSCQTLASICCGKKYAKQELILSSSNHAIWLWPWIPSITGLDGLGLVCAYSQNWGLTGKVTPLEGRKGTVQVISPDSYKFASGFQASTGSTA